MKTFAVVFLSVFLATVFFATNPAVSKVGVFVAAAGALVISSLLAVAIGAQVGPWVPPERWKILAGLGVIAIGLWMLVVRS